MSWWEKLFSSLRPKSASVAGKRPDRSPAELREMLKPYARPAWLPQTVAADHGAAASKFGGMALVSADYPVPECPHCGDEMPLFVQLNPADLPTEMAAQLQGKVLQLFYCTNGDEGCADESYAPFSPSVVARLVPLVEPVTGAAAARSLPARTITGWRAITDYPHWEDREQMDAEVDLSFEENELFLADEGDKLGGWPCWVQGAEYLNCPECNSQMRVVFQLASEQNLPYMFGDMGIGHISQCPQHPEVLAFGWACT